MVKFTFTITGTMETDDQPTAFQTLTQQVADLESVKTLNVKVDRAVIPTGPTPRTQVKGSMSCDNLDGHG